MDTQHGAPVFSKTAPAHIGTLDSRLAAYLVGCDREGYVLRHGFDRSEIDPRGWWEKNGAKLSLHDDRLTREDLFVLGGSTDTDEDLLRFVWHVLAWGSGTSRRQNLSRLESVPRHLDTLRSALEAARDSDPRGGYGSLVRRGGGVIPNLGPSFFTKLLYFASEHTATRCLILDARVARTLYALGWSIGPSYPKRGFWFNWYTDTYVSYCELLAGWSEQTSSPVEPDMFERALFHANGNLDKWGSSDLSVG